MQYGVDAQSTLLAGFLGLLLVIGFYAVRPAEERRALMGIAVSSYLLKAALVPIYFWGLIGAGLLGTAHLDPIEAHQFAQETAIQIELGMLPPELSGWSGFSDHGYAMFCAYLYAWFGDNTLVPRMISAAFSSLALLYLYRLGKLYFDRSVARLAVLLTAFLPFTLLITLEMRKDSIVQCFALFVLYHSLVLIGDVRQWPRRVALVALGLVLIYPLRDAFILPFLGLVSISFIAARRNVLTAAAAAVPVLVFIVAMQFSVPEESKISLQHNVERLQAKAQAPKRGAAAGRGGLTAYARIQSPSEIWKLPLSTAVVLVSPFPPYYPPRFPYFLYDWTNLICLLLYPWLIIGVMSFVREERFRERALLLLFPAVFLILIGAIHPSITRYRETVFPIILLFIAVGFHRRNNMLVSALTYAGLGGLAMVVYAARLT